MTVNIIVDDMLVHYSRQGKGRPILLLHGWADQLDTFDSISDLLVNDFEVIRLDLAGFGSSQPPGGAWSLDDFVQQVSSFLKKIDVVPFAVVGHSNGGAIAVKAIGSGSLAAERLVLIASAGVRSERNATKKIMMLVAKVGKGATFVLPRSVRHKLRRRLYESIGSDLTVSPGMEATFKRVVAEDVISVAKLITIPTLIINGSIDTATPVRYGRQFNDAISGSRFSVIEGAGHFVHQTNASRVGDLIRDFLE